MKKIIRFFTINLFGCAILFAGVAFIKNSTDIGYWGEAARILTAFCFLIVLGIAILASEIFINNQN